MANPKNTVKFPTNAQLDGVFTHARGEREARIALIGIVKEAHKQGRDLLALQARFLIGRTLDLVPAVKKLRLNSYAADTLDWSVIQPLWAAEAKRANPDADPKSKATKEKGGVRNADFHKAYRAAETAWSAIRRDAGAMDTPEGEGKRSGAGKGRPQGTTGGETSQGPVNAGKVAGEGNVAPNPAPKADKPDTPAALVTPAATTNKDAAQWVAGKVAEIMAFIEANPVTPEIIREAAIPFAKEVQRALVLVNKRK